MTAMVDESDDVRTMQVRLRRGDSQALASLFCLHRDRLRRMVESRLDARLRRRVSASDILQEVYIDALKRLPHYQAEPDVPFFIWLRTVTVQRLVDLYRHHLEMQMRSAKREVRLGVGDAAVAASGPMAELVADMTSPSQAAQDGETEVRLREALDRLDPADREVLVLRHFEQLGNGEVADRLGIQAAAASKRYVRAVERLKDVLERMPGFAEGAVA